MNKFTEHFSRLSGGEYDEVIKLNNAEYDEGKRALVVRFNISSANLARFTDDDKNKIKDMVQSMFEGVAVTVEYVKAFADENVVRNKVLEYFNSHNEAIFSRLDENALAVSVSDKYIEIKLQLETPIYMMFDAGGEKEKLEDYLDANFNQVVEVTAYEKRLDASSVEDEDISVNTVVRTDTSLRLVSVETGDKIYARGRVGGISQMPNYITDVKGALENVVLCGKMYGVNIREYNNKKFNPDDPKSGPEKLPLARFYLDDTTGKIECVSFLKPEEREAFEKIEDYTQVVCAGKTAISSYNNALGFTVNAIFAADIDFSSIRLITKKGEPLSYETVRPEPYSEMAQTDLFSSAESKVLPMLKNKTFVIFDFEATDKFPETAEPIELSALKVKDGKAIESFNTLVNPGFAIPARITAITHIDDEMVKDAPSAAKVIPDFYKFTRGAVLVGHNVNGYDFPLLNKVGQREGYFFENEVFDTLDNARKYIPESPNYKLETLSRHFGFAHENAHRAMSDVVATYDLLKEIARRMSKNG